MDLKRFHQPLTIENMIFKEKFLSDLEVDKATYRHLQAAVWES